MLDGHTSRVCFSSSEELYLQNQQVCQKHLILVVTTCTAHTDTKLINWLSHTATACYRLTRWQVFSEGSVPEGHAAELSCEILPANIHFTMASLLFSTLHIDLYQTAIVISSCCYNITNHDDQGTHDTCKDSLENHNT